ncbi:dihydroorotase [Candidatus Woesearchaeota archaeon]|nr:dihydroorotase [Candidatus Woesearchaeota archaeon]
MLLIKNGKVLINGEFLERSILIGNDGRIEKIAVDAKLKTADEVLDAAGKYALPGVIDVHVHCREPGLTHKEDFLTASKAAAAGGVATIFDMPNTKPATTTVALLEEKRKLAAAKCIVNYGFHFGATSDNIEEIKKVKNIAAVKVYMGSSTGNLLVTDEKMLNDIFGSGKRIMVHAENEAMIKANEEKHRSDSDGTKLHLKIRGNSAAAKEVERAIAIGRKHGTRLHICHMSAKEEAGIISAAKKSYNRLSCEVTPHHLFLTADSAKELGNYAKVNPPLRQKEDVAALWNAIASGTVDMIATDHAPHIREEKEQNYWNVPSGVPGLQTMLPLMLDAVNKGRLTLQQLIKLTSENPAAVFGVKGKGRIAVGMDADIAIVDMHKEKTIKNDEMLSKCGWTPFDGWKVKGVVAATIVNGKIIYGSGQISDEKTKGKEVIFNGN